MAGELVNRLSKEKNVSIIPVDSEHSAIFQCLRGEESESVEKIILTASGGPFLRKSMEELSTATPEGSTEPPQLVHGRQNYHRFGKHDE